MSSEPTSWRQQWLAIVANPANAALTRGLLDALEDDQRRDLAALGTGSRDDQLIALARLLRDLFTLHHVAHSRAAFEPGPYWRGLIVNFRAPSSLDDDDDDDDDEHEHEHASSGVLQVLATKPSAKRPSEVARGIAPRAPRPPLGPADPFFAWDLAHRVASDPPPQRAARIDAALDAFEAILESPRDPGNDNGPMCAMVPYMSVAQVQRALAIERRMADAGWLAPNWTAAYLVSQLAALGQWAEVDAKLAAIAEPGGRALALGRVAAHVMLRGHPGPLVEPTRRAWLDGGGLVEFVRGLTQVSTSTSPQAPLTSDAVRECIALVADHPDAEARSGALVLLAPWHAIDTPERWLDAIDEHAVGDARVHALYSLAEEIRERPRQATVVRVAIARMFELPRPRSARWLGDFAEVFTALPRDEAFAVVGRILVNASQDGSWPLAALGTVEFAALLRWLGGEATDAVIAAHLREVETCLGPSG